VIKQQLKKKTMGKYLNVNSKGRSLGASYMAKVGNLMDDGAVEVSDAEFQDNMVCVVDNGMFAAAGYAYDEREFEVFRRPDGRPKTWLVYPYAKDLAQ
jgi:hypothetical protein